MPQSDWTLIIRPDSSWGTRLGELLRYRDLIFLFVHRDFTSQYKQTILGPLWALIQPILSTSVFYLVFHHIAHISTDGLPSFLFYLSGTIVWNYFSGCFTGTSSTFISNSYLFGKVYFPRLCVPVATVLNRALTFGIQFLFFLFVYCFFVFRGAPIHPTFLIILTPVLLLQMALLGLGLGILTSALTTRYRDLQFLLSFGIQLWFYATPVVYPLSIVPQGIRKFFIVNPMTSVMELFRYFFLGTGTLSLSGILFSWAVTVVILLCGLGAFKRVEKTFIDTV